MLMLTRLWWWWLVQGYAVVELRSEAEALELYRLANCSTTGERKVGGTCLSVCRPPVHVITAHPLLASRTSIISLIPRALGLRSLPVLPL